MLTSRVLPDIYIFSCFFKMCVFSLYIDIIKMCVQLNVAFACKKTFAYIHFSSYCVAFYSLLSYI